MVLTSTFRILNWHNYTHNGTVVLRRQLRTNHFGERIAGLRILWPKGREGSNPFFRSKILEPHNQRLLVVHVAILQGPARCLFVPAFALSLVATLRANSLARSL